MIILITILGVEAACIAAFLLRIAWNHCMIRRTKNSKQ
jgi:hypothetical protein